MAKKALAKVREPTGWPRRRSDFDGHVDVLSVGSGHGVVGESAEGGDELGASVGAVRAGDGGKGGLARGGGEDATKGGGEALKFLEEKEDVLEGDDDAAIINVGHEIGDTTEAVITDAAVVRAVHLELGIGRRIARVFRILESAPRRRMFRGIGLVGLS